MLRYLADVYRALRLGVPEEAAFVGVDSIFLVQVWFFSKTSCSPQRFGLFFRKKDPWKEWGRCPLELRGLAEKHRTKMRRRGPQPPSKGIFSVYSIGEMCRRRHPKSVGCSSANREGHPFVYFRPKGKPPASHVCLGEKGGRMVLSLASFGVPSFRVKGGIKGKNEFPWTCFSLEPLAARERAPLEGTKLSPPS